MSQLVVIGAILDHQLSIAIDNANPGTVLRLLEIALRNFFVRMRNFYQKTIIGRRSETRWAHPKLVLHLAKAKPPFEILVRATTV